MEPRDIVEHEEILLREAGELLGISRKGVQHLVNQELLRRELRVTPAGTKYGVVFRSDVLRLAEERRIQAIQASAHRGPGRPLKLPTQRSNQPLESKQPASGARCEVTAEGSTDEQAAA